MGASLPSELASSAAPQSELRTRVISAIVLAPIAIVALALGGIHMSTIPAIDYALLYHERVVRSVANNTRDDGRDFLRVAAEIPIRVQTEVFPLSEANQALDTLKNDAIRGAGVLAID